MSRCPFVDLSKKPTEIASETASKCPFHEHKQMHASDFHMPADIEINIVIRGGSHQSTPQAAALLRDIGGPDRIREFCTRFYSHAFIDQTISEFFFETDGAEGHAKRLADWIIEKMDPNLTPWTDSGRLGQRQPSHHKAWNNIKRSKDVRGNHFDLKDARIWMRLHFMALRECNLMIHEPFVRFYVQFIEHFIAVYEREAPRYAEEDLSWSENQDNIDIYHEDHIMHDVISHRGRTMLEILRR